METKLLHAPIHTYATEDLIERAAETAKEPSVIVHDALLLALAEDARTVMVTADGRLLKKPGGSRYASPAVPLGGVGGLLRWGVSPREAAPGYGYVGRTPLSRPPLRDALPPTREPAGRRGARLRRVLYGTAGTGQSAIRAGAGGVPWPPVPEKKEEAR